MNRLARNTRDCGSLMLFQFSLIALMVLCEYMMYLSLNFIGYDWLYDIHAFRAGRGATWVFWISKTMVEFSMASPCFSLVRRLFLDVAIDSDMSETRRYINAHSVKYYSGAFYASLIQAIIKFTAITPGVIFAHGIYYFAREITINELTSRGLFALTACISLTAAWAFLSAHYFISLSLTPYIISLNPRANIFDACDMSVKLMDGKHGRYLGFMLHFVKFLPAVLLVYPFFAIYPYFKVSYSLFMYELMGNGKKDKLPGMIKRWKKYL